MIGLPACYRINIAVAYLSVVQVLCDSRDSYSVTVSWCQHSQPSAIPKLLLSTMHISSLPTVPNALGLPLNALIIKSSSLLLSMQITLLFLSLRTASFFLISTNDCATCRSSDKTCLPLLLVGGEIIEFTIELGFFLGT